MHETLRGCEKSILVSFQIFFFQLNLRFFQFFGLSDLVDLELRNLNAESGETSLDPKVFEGLEQLKYLSLTGNGIADLPEVSFC